MSEFPEAFFSHDWGHQAAAKATFIYFYFLQTYFERYGVFFLKFISFIKIYSLHFFLLVRNNSTCKCFSLAIEKSLLLQLHIFSSIRPALCFDGEGRERRRKKKIKDHSCAARDVSCVKTSSAGGAQ